MADQSVQAPVFTPSQVTQEEEMREVAIIQQVEWYFSRQNLIADFFLKRQMNDELWVSLATIIDFPKMLNLNVTQKDEAHLAHLLSTRSQIIEVDSTNRFIRPIWAVRSTLQLKGVPTNVSAVAIHGFLESIADARCPLGFISTRTCTCPCGVWFSIRLKELELLQARSMGSHLMAPLLLPK